MIKVLERLEIEGRDTRDIPKHNQVSLQQIYSQHQIECRVNPKAFQLKLEMRQACLLSPYLLNIVFEVLAKAIRQLKEIKGIWIGKEEVKAFLFAGDMIVYLSYPKNSTRKLLQLINTFSKVAGYKINSPKVVLLLDTNDKWTPKEIREMKISQ